MRLFRLCALALAAESAHGYLDTTPFFMFSTSEFLTTTSHLQSSSLIVSDIALSLSSCPSDYYILVSQPGVSSRDYSSKKSTPTLARALSRQNPRPEIRSSIVVTDVLGPVDSTPWLDVLNTKCGVTQMNIVDGSQGAIYLDKLASTPQLIQLLLSAPSAGTSRSADLASNDALFATLLDLLPTQNYTVLYTTTSAQDAGFVAANIEKQVGYVMQSEIQDSLHMDLKRDLGAHASASSNNQTIVNGPLFDKYQFFTPGIFMGFLVGILLLSILYVGISALASLQVTYAAFDKEQGPLAGAKKQ